MKKFIFILLFFLTSCLSDNEDDFRKSALNIEANFDHNLLKKFCKWGVIPRGNEIWYTNDFNVIFFKNNDSLRFRIFQMSDFESKFPMQIKFSKGYSKYSFFDFVEVQNKFQISVNGSIKYIVDKNSFFKEKNPFEEIKQLSKIKNKYKIIMIDSSCQRNEIEFYLSSRHVLIYFPNGHKLEKNKTNSFEIINDKWILKKLKDPVDFS